MKQKKDEVYLPLAARMRPRHLDEFIGQKHLLGEKKPLANAITQGILHSMILWGPPGTGKTTLAQLITENSHAHFVRLSAIFSGVKDIRNIVDAARKRRDEQSKATVLFIDEIHRFNKAQQDVFLPFIEDGTLVLIGATTHNPSFELNNALLSRTRVYILKPLTEDDLLLVLDQALADPVRGLGEKTFIFSQKLKLLLIKSVDGDARQLLNLLEILSEYSKAHDFVITEALLKDVIENGMRRFDKGGDIFYDQISALHKAVRGSSPDAALYWLCRMLDGGCDPLYLGRRIIRMANEDIGLSDPRALTLALECVSVYERLGSPEGELALAQAVIFLSCAPKSNAVYMAFNEAKKWVKNSPSYEVPLHLRNAPTKLMKELSFGKHYRYAHDEKEAYASGENYFPEAMEPRQFYHPTDRGLEVKIKERLQYLRELDQKKKNS